METTWQAVLDRLRRSPWQIALVMTGGGSGAISHCFARAGASANFIEAVVPYSTAALQDYLGQPPAGGSASLETAQALAVMAQQRASRLQKGSATTTAGIALVAALPTSPPRRGEDRIHVVLQTASDQWTWSKTLDKATATRATGEQAAESMVLVALQQLIEQGGAVE